MVENSGARMGRGLMARILLAATFVIVLVLAGFALYNDAVNRAETEERVSETLSILGKSMARSVDNWLGGRVALTEAAMEQLGRTDNADVKAEAFSLPTLVNAFDMTYYGTDAGVMVPWPPTEMPAGYDPRVRPWYKAAEAARGPTMTEPYLDATSGGLTVTVAVPRLIDGKVVGVVGSDFSIDTIRNMLTDAELGDLGYLFIADASGKVLIHPDLERVGKTFGEIFPGSQVTLTGALQDVTEANGSARLLRFEPIPGLPGVTWYVGMSVDRDVAFQAVSDFRRTVLIAVIVAVGVMVLTLGTVFRQLLARPLVAVTGAMGRIAAGDYHVAVPGLGRKDEIGAIASAVEVFRENGLERERLRAEQAAEQDAKQRRVEMVDRLIDLFGADVVEALDAMSRATREVEQTAGMLTRNSEQSSQGAAGAAPPRPRRRRP